jgi:hypothetical protein
VRRSTYIAMALVLFFAPVECELAALARNNLRCDNALNEGWKRIRVVRPVVKWIIHDGWTKLDEGT